MKINEKFLESYLNSNSPTGFEYELGGQKVWMDYLSKFVTDYKFPGVLDFAFQAAASKYATTPAHQQMLRVLEAPLALGTAFYVPPDIPSDRLAALREAFDKMLVDPAFKAEAVKMDLTINPRGPKDVAEVVDKLYETPKNVIGELEAIIAPKK